MPLYLKRRNGEVTPFRNSEYIPFYYLIPKSFFKRSGTELRSIPRNPQEIFHDRAACEFIESDLFKLFIIDATAHMVWRYMGFKEYIEIYSGYDPAWRLAHNPDYWIKELTDEGIIPTVQDLVRDCHEDFGWVPEEETDVYLQYIVPNVMDKYNMHAIIEIEKEYRCFEDFDYRRSRQKTDFYRKWYHTRTKHPQISYEGYREDYAEKHHGQQWDEIDYTQEVEENITAKVLVDKFKKRLGKKDLLILEKRMQGETLEEIAKELGYKHHSGVIKRIRKIGLAYEKFTGEDYGFTEDKII